MAGYWKSELFHIVASNIFLFRVTFLLVKNVIDFEYMISHWLLADAMPQWIRKFNLCECHWNRSYFFCFYFKRQWHQVDKWNVYLHEWICQFHSNIIGKYRKLKKKWSKLLNTQVYRKPPNIFTPQTFHWNMTQAYTQHNSVQWQTTDKCDRNESEYKMFQFINIS